MKRYIKDLRIDPRYIAFSEGGKNIGQHLENVCIEVKLLVVPGDERLEEIVDIVMKLLQRD